MSSTTGYSSANYPRGFPWGSNRPTINQRLIVALVIGVIGAVVHYVRSADNGGLSDFSTVWYGARFLLDGQNPYALIGPHRMIGLPSYLLYPAPALVVVMPLTLLPAHWAGTIFVLVSATLLGFGATRNGWHLLPIFPSVAFLMSAQMGQWSILMTAAFFLPALTFLSVAKPQASIPVLASSETRAAWVFALVGAVVTVSASFVLLPGWASEWWHVVASTDYFRVPIASFEGIAVVLVLLRWRRPEAWLVFVSACLPQTWYPYNSLILLVVAATYREACGLSLISSVGWLIAYFFFVGEWRSEETRIVLHRVLIALCYLPSALIILGRPNEGPTPFWLAWLTSHTGHD